MLSELREDNAALTGRLREAHEVAGVYLNAVHKSLAPIDSSSDHVVTERTKAVQELG
jgi:hypothetical protein